MLHGFTLLFKWILLFYYFNDLILKLQPVTFAFVALKVAGYFTHLPLSELKSNLEFKFFAKSYLTS